MPCVRNLDSSFAARPAFYVLLPELPKTMKKTVANFGDAVVAWQKKHGRHDLPWQNTQDPYAVWLSEIMLQQTQVATVRAYFARFMQRFPTVADLAAAHQDEVLGLWSGLGYYSRARNMHRAAQVVVALHDGHFPRSAEALQTLPGIGRSTAAAVASLCFGEPIAILDGNVKRVLTRYLGFDQDLASARIEKDLWALAQTMLPKKQVTQAMPRYTQGVMDLGATVCTPKKPNCAQCPMATDCVAKAEGQPERYPVKTRKLKRTSEQLWLLQAETEAGEVAVAGMAIARQRPATANGVVFMLLEDEVGQVNLIVPPPVYERFRPLVRGEPRFVEFFRLFPHATDFRIGTAARMSGSFPYVLAFVILLTLILLMRAFRSVFLALKAGNMSSMSFGPSYSLVARFDNIGGLKPRAPVKSAGVVVGRVESIGFDDKTFQAKVVLRMEGSYHFPKDSSAKILTSGLLGEQYIGLEPGGDEKNFADGDRVKMTQSAIVLENLISQFLFSKAAEASGEEKK